MARSRTIRRSRKRKYGASVSFLPDSVQAFVARRVVDGVALGFCALSAFIVAALITYNKTDPSWNTAATADQRVQNIAGITGAWTADILLQTLGGAALVLALGLFFWGVRIFRRESIRPISLRIASLLVATVLAAVALAQIPSREWTVHPYLGASAGTLILNHLVEVARAFKLPHGHHLLASAAGIMALGVFLFTAGVTRYELASVWFRVKLAVYTLCGLAMASGYGFYAWVMRYNEPDYEPERLSIMERMRAVREGWLERRAAQEEGEEQEDGEDDEEALDEEDEAEEEEDETAEDEEAEEEDDSEDEDDEEASEDDEEVEDEEEDEDEEPAPPRRKSAAALAASKNAAKGKKSTKQEVQHKFAFLKDNGEWELPPLALIEEPAPAAATPAYTRDALKRNAELLKNVLADYNVKGEIRDTPRVGPVVTLYEFVPEPGTRTSRVISLSDDIARSMSAISVRCSVIPGRNAIGIELPNKVRQTVYMQEMLEAKEYQKGGMKLPLILGKNIEGEPIMADLTTMPHLMIAGTTGSGKSVSVNAMITSLLYRLSPAECRFIMIDPKMLELSVYNDIPHLLSPVVTEPAKAVVALKWAVREMENRNFMLSKLGVRGIDGYNQRIRDAIKKKEQIVQKVQTGFDPDSGKPVFEDRPLELVELPYIVIIVDEFADLMLTAGKDVENAIQRLAQMARAAGIHLIMATQRPSVDVVTGVIRANFPRRISFHVTSKIDSRVILGEAGAEQLLGKGDMLYLVPGARMMRLQAPKLSDTDVSKIVGFLKAQGRPNYIDNLTVDPNEGAEGDMFGGADEETDELYDKAVAVIAREGKVSTSFIQRHLQIGYNRAARIIEEMERQGVISKANAVGKREILISDYSDH